VLEEITPTLYSWASILDQKAKAQAITCSQMPFIYPHVALMPDAHAGKGATVGSVIPTLGAIIPAAVGVDIGCGMGAVKTQWHVDEFRAGGNLSKLREAIERAIPLGAGHYNRRITENAAHLVAGLEALAAENGVDPDFYAGHWRNQIGSLGSGNHFIEVTKDEKGWVWLFLHSGSRGVGNLIAQHHINVARGLMEKQRIKVPELNLSYLTEGTQEFDDYLKDLMWAQEFARQNREEMMHRLQTSVSEFMGADVKPLEVINCHHNFTQKETHYGKEVWISRKGAISAKKGELGLIPGSMGTASYVVTGKGNKLALDSSPHGAGRNYSRTAARKTFTLADLEAAMGDIEFRHTAAFIDEIPAAYKPIDQVMADSADLVTIKHELNQIINVKGD